uniref:small monomeric GTPase n=1 Tax=Cyprinus carpio TaxID=7962 RepID=A0A8C1K418_CYPCA
MSDRKSKKNQRLGSSRRGPKGFNRNIEKDDDDDGFQQIAESGDGQNQFHTTSDYHATQFDHPPSSSIEQQTSPLECPPHARSHKDLLKETELPERKRKMGSTRKSTGRFKGERNLDDMGTTEELDEEYVTQPNTSTTEEQHASLTEEQSNFPSDLSLQTKSSGFGKDSGTTLMFAVSENKEKGTIHHQEITSHSHEVVSDMPIDEAMGPSVHSIAVTVAECELLREDSVMFNEPKIFSHQETQKASTSGQKRRMGSTRRPLRGQNSENVGVQEHSQNMAENEKKAKVMGEAKLEMSEEMAQIWDDVARDDPSSHTESALLLSQSLLANRAEQKEPDVLAGTETMNQPVAFPLVDSEKPLPETSSHHGTPLLNEALDFKFGSHTEDLDVLNKVLKEAGGHLSDNSQHVSDTRKDTNPSYDFRDENTETKKEVLKQKEETQLEELALHDQESSLGQHDIATTNNYDGSMVQRIVGGSRSFDMPVSNISHAVPPKTNFPHEMRDVVEERQEIHIEMKQDNNVFNVASVTCDTLTNLVCITEDEEDPHILATIEKENMSDERGSETEHAFEMIDQGNVRDHNVTQIIMDVRDHEKDGETSTETIWISHQEPCDVLTENEELYKGQEHYSSNTSLTHSPTQDDAAKMLENEEVRKDKKETENTAVNDVTSKSEEMFSFEDSATDTGSHAQRQLFMQSPVKEGYDLHENLNEKHEKEEILFSVESENVAFDRGNERSEGTDGIKEMDAAPVLTLDVGDADLHLEIEAQNKTFDSNSEADGTEENISGASLLVRENKVTGNTVESIMTTELDFLQTSDAHVEASKVSENAEKEVSGETILKQSDINIIPDNSHEEEAHAKSSPVIQKRKMGSTRRPLKGNKGLRKGHDEKEIFIVEDEPSPDESRHTALSSCDISESQTFTKIHAGSKENTGDVDIAPAEGDTESHSENKTFDSTAFEGEATEENICKASVLVREVEFIGDAVIVESNITTESELIQNNTSSEAKLEALKVSDNVVYEVLGETDAIPTQSDTTIIPEDTQKEEAHLKLTVTHKRKMGSTRRPLRGNKGQRKEIEHHDGNETLDSEGMINAEKETISLQNEPSSDESTLQSLKDGAKEQEMEICEKNDVDPVEESESTLLQSSCTSDLVSEESTAISICHITESQTLTKIDEESQENTADAERVPAEDDKNLQLEIVSQNKTSDPTTREAEETEKNIHDATVLVREVEVIGDTNTVESNMTNDSEFLQRSPDAHMEALNVSEKAEKEVSGEINTIPEQSDISIIPADSHREETHSKSSPVIQKRKMGSTRRPLKGNKGLRKGHDEKEIFIVEDEPSPDESRHTALSSCDISESQTFTKIHAGSKENTGDVDIAPAEGDTESHSENKTIYSPAFEGEATEENICAASDTSTDAKLESLISERAENEISLKTDIISKQSVPNIIPEDLHGDEVHTKLNLNVHKRKMGSTRRPLKGNKGQRKGDDLSEVSEEKGMDNTGDDSNSLTEAIHLKEGTKDKFVMTISHEDVHQIVLEPEQTENTHNVIPTQELRATQDDVVHENNSQKIPATQEKRRKMGSTRRNPGAMHGKNMADNEDVLVVAEDRETKKAEDGLEEELSISQSKDMSSVSSTDLDSEMLASVTDLKVENDHLNSSRSTVPETHENTLQICDNQLVNADVTKHPQSETVTIEKRRKMGSTRKNLREGGIRGKRDGHEDTEIEDTDLQMSQGSEMSLVREDVRQQTTHDYSNQPADSLLSEIERALNKTSLSSLSCDWELIVKEPNPDSLANAPDLNMPENSEIKSLQPMPSAHSAPNSPGRRRKMGSTRKNPRQQLNAEREEEDKEDGEIDENSKTNKQEKKDLERAEASVVHNITENKLNKEYLDVSSAHTSSNQLEETTNPVSQEKTSPSTKRKFGSRRANKSKQGLGRLADSDFGNELEDGDHKPDSSEVKDKLHSDDLAVCDPCLTLQPENQPASEQRNMEAKNEEAASKGTDAGLVSLDQIIKHDRTGAKQTVNLKNRISDTEVVQFNVVMVGNSCVGKTSFIRRFHEGLFTEDYRSTIGVDTFKETVELPDRTVRLQIWDTAGQERFHSITTQLFHKADGLLLMYDITCSKSFISVRDWISQARERAPDDVIMMLLGNKNDSVNREVQIQEGADLAREYNIHFMECSAAAGVNVSESMRSLAEMLVQRKSEKEKHTTLRREAPQKKSGCC